MSLKVVVDVRGATDAEKLFVAETLRQLEDPSMFDWPSDESIWMNATHIGFWFKNSKCVYSSAGLEDEESTLLTLDEFKSAFSETEEE